MAATDQTYRNQRALDIVFAVSCLLMLVSVVWMFAADYNRDWKVVQREFRDVETALSERLMLEKLPEAEEVNEKLKAVADARQDYRKALDQVRGEEARLSAKRDRADSDYREVKADYDSKASLYDILVEDLGKARTSAERDKLERERQARKAELDQLYSRLTAAKDKLDAADEEFKAKVSGPLEGPKKALDQAEDEMKRLTGVSDRFAKAAAQRSWKLGDTIRNLPVLDAFAAPAKVNQITLPDLTIDYGGFKDVPRYDRCTTCHLAIDRATFDRASLQALARAPEGLGEKLKTARRLLRERQKAGESLGFDPDDLPQSVRTVPLTPGQVTQYCAHPRPDLFVDSNSAHPIDKFGCTTCHAGQGSATDFTFASHTPADASQEHAWGREYGWRANHDWEFPMYSSRFVESSCLKCHHQVTDLVRRGSKNEAPKLLRGYELVRENGCFGCHEISGFKSGRPVGPDLRLEPLPALESQSASDQEKARSDPANLPGALRRVGPGLRRLAEKTNESWARAWVRSPRGFREDTKMPHFYGLSNNTPEVLPDDQKRFPDAEIAGIVHYLFAESRGFLKNEDTYRQYLRRQVGELHAQLKNGPLPDKEHKQLADLTRQLADLALLSLSPRGSADAVHASAAELRQAQERVQELSRKPADGLSGAEKDELTKARGKLDERAEALAKLAKPVPLADEVIDETGTPVDRPTLDKLTAAPNAADKEKRQANGRRLFSERGCLACHSHEGTAKPGPGAPAVEGHQIFGPNLSRTAAKIVPEGGEAARRRWLIQWVMNPNVHSQRTRMPITHLQPEEAADIAEWLLSQDVKRSEEKEVKELEPPEPTLDDLLQLARLYLAKAPAVTKLEVDAALPAVAPADGNVPGFAAERVQLLPADSDERALAGPNVAPDKLKWYIGRKAIVRLGCYGCHDIPGFEQSKPVGTALNDWGKKDPARLAFEDSDAFVREHYNIVPVRRTPQELDKAVAELEEKGKGLTAAEKRELRELKELQKHPWAPDGDRREPYEKHFYDELEHHGREGFLHLKLEDPRSYDFNRLRVWDDRLRMPQFRFARTHRLKGESDEDYRVRQEKEEAEAREAVMTFVLGLVADPVPLKYLNSPSADRLAVARGRQVIDKYNCAGCHQIQPGVYEFRPTPESVKMLEAAYNTASSTFPSDHPFLGHNAWFGAPQTSADRTTAIGVNPYMQEDQDSGRKQLVIRLADALHFTGADGVVRDIPAAALVPLNPDDLVARSDPFGGTFVELLLGRPGTQTPPRYEGEPLGYMAAVNDQRFNNKPDDARAALPPPLYREGERVQPRWLYAFLLDPTVVRPQEKMMLRMPKFNMSHEEAQALVSYFGASARLDNPGAAVTYPYLTIEQRDERYWKPRNDQYLKTLQASIKEAEEKLKSAKDDAAKKPLEAGLKRWREDVEAGKKGQDRYAVGGYRLLTNRELCLQCHDVGSVKAEGPTGPNLALAADRLRPDWTLRYIANPTRMLTYTAPMPQNFPRDSVKWQESFVGPPLDQARAVRDVLMDLPRLSELAESKAGRPAPAAAAAPAAGAAGEGARK
jgi:mono/diheme cytochrome c family protein